MAIIERKRKMVGKEKLVNETVLIDAFDLLILLENVLSGAHVFKCQDETYRDISSVHGSHKREIHLVNNPDMVLAKSENIIITSDVRILDECVQWFNLGRLMIDI
jgi:hypothetical protein